MYTVIIQNQRSIDAFSKYYPLYLQTLNEKKIGVCKWIESGATFSTALPDLEELISDKEEWRAVIVRYEDGSCMKRFAHSPKNPFDYEASKAENYSNSYVSEVPLVRLTQILGGVPVKEIDFVARTESDDSSEIIQTFDTVESGTEDERLSEEQNLGFVGKRPSSIILITVRQKPSEKIEELWLDRREINSSDFWSRNRYPSICRFVVFDYSVGEGQNQKIQDDFVFWNTVLMFSVNSIQHSALQAYKLYNVKLTINRDKLEESLAFLSYKLVAGRKYIENEIRSNMNERLTIRHDVPDFRTDIELPIELSASLEEITISTHIVKPLPIRNNEIDFWYESKKMAEKNLLQSIKDAERAMDIVAADMRENMIIDEDDAEILDKYQKEDVETESNEIFSDLIRLQSLLPTEKAVYRKERCDSAEKIEDSIPRKVNKKPVVLTWLTLFVLTLLTEIPAWITLYNEEKGNLYAMLLMLAALFLIPLGISLIVVLVQCHKVRKLIKQYNSFIIKDFEKLDEDTFKYADYMNDIASYSRGRSYCRVSDKKLAAVQKQRMGRYKHIAAIESLQQRVGKWRKAFYIKEYEINFDYATECRIDLNLKPFENPFYTFEENGSYSIPINSSGDTLTSPFAYIEKIELQREELYNDADRD